MWMGALHLSTLRVVAPQHRSPPVEPLPRGTGPEEHYEFGDSVGELLHDAHERSPSRSRVPVTAPVSAARFCGHPTQQGVAQTLGDRFYVMDSLGGLHPCVARDVGLRHLRRVSLGPGVRSSDGYRQPTTVGWYPRGLPG